MKYYISDRTLRRRTMQLRAEMPLITQFSNILSYYSQADVAAVWPFYRSCRRGDRGGSAGQSSPWRWGENTRSRYFYVLLLSAMATSRYPIRESFLPFKLDPELLLSHRRSSWCDPAEGVRACSWLRPRGGGGARLLHAPSLSRASAAWPGAVMTGDSEEQEIRKVLPRDCGGAAVTPRRRPGPQSGSDAETHGATSALRERDRPPRTAPRALRGQRDAWACRHGEGRGAPCGPGTPRPSSRFAEAARDAQRGRDEAQRRPAVTRPSGRRHAGAWPAPRTADHRGLHVWKPETQRLLNSVNYGSAYGTQIQIFSPQVHHQVKCRNEF